ncbi:PspC domain-containing protein [Halobacillus salinus]|uniref:PspC domain-containing protein n=1 Tax=Halobacillus salinus TaxID=192814 RepID=A0A4Z0H645_9BACI|nr:PspC domain-containing protein [Halobacillus salinus]TGB04881.1 PspC domain-containing protein [Halobacillus salinus]
MQKKLRKSHHDRSIAGVCGGIAEYLGVSSFMVRLLFIFLPVSLLVYVILANMLSDHPPSL